MQLTRAGSPDTGMSNGPTVVGVPALTDWVNGAWKFTNAPDEGLTAMNRRSPLPAGMARLVVMVPLHTTCPLAASSTHCEVRSDVEMPPVDSRTTKASRNGRRSTAAAITAIATTRGPRAGMGGFRPARPTPDPAA